MRLLSESFSVFQIIMPFRLKLVDTLIRYKAHILWSVAIILMTYFLYFSIRHSANPSYGFSSYYTASRLLIEGKNPASFYNDDYFSSEVEKFVPGIYEIYLINVPTTTLVFLPLASLDYSTARILWTGFNLLLLTVSVIFLLKSLKFEQEWIPLILILIFCFQPIYANMMNAQIYILMFFLLALTFISYRSGKRKLPGIITALMLLIKSVGVFLIPLFMVQKKWKFLMWIGITFALIFIITIPLFGFQSWLAYGNKLLNYTSSATLSVTAYQSVHSFFHHFFVIDEKWNPEPLFNLAIVGKSLTLIISLFILVVTIAITMKYKKSELAFASFVIIGIILSPASIDYHYVMMLIPGIILIDWLKRNKSKGLWMLFIFSFALIALSIPYTSPKVTGGFLALFAYPKLYGAIGLWILSLKASAVRGFL